VFVDHIRIHAKAGDGGCGCVSFRREKFVPKGGPDGGDGGRGGDIILRADPHEDNLAKFFYEPIIRAKPGAHGSGKNCYGKAAKPLIVNVPIGTLVYRVPKQPEPEIPEDPASSATFINFAKQPDDPAAPEPVSEEELELVADLTEAGQEFVLCAGGEGGKGNTHFKSARNRVPTQFTPGGEGEEGDFVLELRKIADAGLVGYPNAGKSTLIGRISAAHPKVAPYPFTTLHPIIGVVEFPGFQRATIADIPGLIEGAHRNVGLGHDFLRHIVRCKLLLFVVDAAGSEGRHPAADIASLREELKLYDPALAARPWLIIANKVDLPDAPENIEQLRTRYPKVEVIPISAETGSGIPELKTRLAQLLQPSAEEPTPQPATTP
jgi:GTP-binding protein